MEALPAVAAASLNVGAAAAASTNVGTAAVDLTVEREGEEWDLSPLTLTWEDPYCKKLPVGWKCCHCGFLSPK